MSPLQLIEKMKLLCYAAQTIARLSGPGRPPIYARNVVRRAVYAIYTAMFGRPDPAARQALGRLVDNICDPL